MSRQWVTEADDYVCKLPQETQVIAKEELREDDFTRRQALESLRTWIQQNPRIENCRMDAVFLLRFLRFTKYSLPLAQETLERYLLLRQAYSSAFHLLDINNPRADALFEKGAIIGSPFKDQQGRRLLIGRPGMFDPYYYTNEDALRLAGIVHETLMEDEENQVRGFIYFCDGKGVGFPYLTLFTPKEYVRMAKNGERTVPMRHKEAHAINAPPSLKFAIDFGFSLVSEKLKQRVKIHNSLDEALECIDRKLMPKEYGGDMPLEEMIQLWKAELLAHRDVVLRNDKMKVNLDCYSQRAREGAVSALKRGLCKMDSMDTGTNEFGLCGSFRKLEVD